MSMRPSIDQLPSGRWRLRIRVNGQRKSAGTFETEEQAEATFVALRESHQGSSGHTLASIGARVLDYRENVRKLASSEVDRQVWDSHVLDAPFAHVPIESIKRIDIQRHLKTKLAAGIAEPPKRALMLMRFAFREAVELDLMTAHPIPAGDFRLAKPRPRREAQLASLPRDLWPRRRRRGVDVPHPRGATSGPELLQGQHGAPGSTLGKQPTTEKP